MMTSSNGNIFRVIGPLCREFTGPGEFPAQKPVTWSFDVYFDLRLNKRLCKQSWGWWFETLLCPLWHHSNVTHSKWTTCKCEVWGDLCIGWGMRCLILVWIYGVFQLCTCQTVRNIIVTIKFTIHVPRLLLLYQDFFQKEHVTLNLYISEIKLKQQ